MASMIERFEYKCKKSLEVPYKSEAGDKVGTTLHGSEHYREWSHNRLSTYIYGPISFEVVDSQS